MKTTKVTFTPKVMKWYGININLVEFRGIKNITCMRINYLSKVDNLVDIEEGKKP